MRKKMNNNKTMDQLAVAAAQKTKEREYWVSKLAGDWETCLFPYDMAGVGEPVYEEFVFELRDSVSAALVKMSGGSDVRLHIILSAALTALLYRYTYNRGVDGDVVMGAPILKPDEGAESTGFTNTLLAFHTHVKAEMTFKELLLSVRQTVVDAYENQTYPMEILTGQLNRPIVAGKGFPLFSAALVLEGIHEAGMLEGVHLDMKILLKRDSKDGDKIGGQWVYDGLRYKEDNVARLVRRLEGLLETVTSAMDTKLWDMELLDEGERKQILEQFNDTTAEFPEGETLHGVFEKQVEIFGGNIALKGRGLKEDGTRGYVEITYWQLNERTGKLAGLLRQRGVERGNVVALQMERSVEMIVGILAVLKAGGIYLPIARDYPEHRVEYMLRDSGARWVLTQMERGERGERGEGGEGTLKVRAGIEGIEYINLEEQGLLKGDAAFSGPAVTGSDAAYIIYTSGSTGKPKGVVVSHGSAVNLLFDLQKKYPLKEGDSFLMKTSYLFDVSVSEIFGWYWGGGCLVLLEPGGEKEPRAILEAVEKFGVTHINFVPAMFNIFTRQLEGGNIHQLASLRHIFLAGEALAPELVKQFRELNSGIGLENLYGPTEGTVYASGYSLAEWDGVGGVPIGTPLANVRLLILDPAFDASEPGEDGISLPLKGIGEIGELCITGRGVALGYLNRPELTAEKFISSPSLPLPASLSSPLSPIYKTGDLAQWQPDGNIRFLGRMDHQVKVRGFRIELGEIENRLLAHELVRETAVLARKDDTGDHYLCAYFVSTVGSNGSASEEPSLSTKAVLDGGQGGASPLRPPRRRPRRAAGGNIETLLRQHLEADLPEYMVPTFFVELEALPVTGSGKVDGKALPEPGGKGRRGVYAAPRNEVEKRLTEIWGEVLGLDAGTIGIDDNFLELGGHSLKATTLVYRIYKEYEVNLDIQDIFAHPFIGAMAQRVSGEERETYHEIEAGEKREYYELSYAQRRLWVLCQFEEDSTAYNMPAAVVISGAFSPDAFQRAIDTLVRRHDSLRTLFVSIEGEPYQRVLPDLPVKLEQVDLRNLEENAREAETRRLYRESSNGAFDLEKGPLLRFILVRETDTQHVLIYNIHHIVNDGWSQGILSNELTLLYNFYRGAREERGDPLRPLTLQYRDYTAWHNSLIEGAHFSDSRDYWLEKFADRPNGIELPLDHQRQPIQTFNGGRVEFVIDAARTAALQALTLREDATFFMGLLALLDLFFYRYTGQNDVILGSPIANRKRPELHQLVGFLVNTLIFRTDVKGTVTFKELLATVKEEALSCYGYQDFPFDLLVEELELERDMSQSPIFNVMVAHNNAETEDEALKLDGATLRDYVHSGDFNMSKFDLIFFMDDIVVDGADGNNDGMAADRGENGGAAVRVRLEYNSDLMERETVEGMAESFMCLLDDVLGEPDLALSEYGLLTEAQYGQVVETFNDTKRDYSTLTLQEMFEARVAAAGEATAVVYGDQRLSYGELNEKANCLAHYLRNGCGVRRNDIIGVSMDRSLDMILVLWGIIKSGAGYLAVDPTYPQERVLHVLADSGAERMIIDEMRPELFGDYTGQLIHVKEEWETISGESADNPTVVNSPSDILYVNYTSGSTGTPNGALLSHDILTNLIRWQHEDTVIDFSFRCLQFTSINFCVSFQEIMGTLTGGGELHLIGDVERQDIDYLMDFLAEHKIQNLFLPFSYLNFLFNESSRWDRSFDHDLRHIITAGEQLKITAGLKRFLDLNPTLKLHNHYGSTEMHVVTSYTLDASTAEKTRIPPAGKPIGNVRIYILDEFLNPVPTGVYGELCVAGNIELLGYINNEELTNRKLFRHPYLRGDGVRLYRSGDMGRWLRDGNIELRGRKDFLVKIRGFRVEPGEIESKILAIEAVRECVVVVKEDGTGQKYLAAYVAADGIDGAGVKKIIGGQLPQYMIPHLVMMDALPLMPNGKVDRGALPEPELDTAETYEAPGDEVEKTLTAIWAELLGVDAETISVDGNFFDLGGHSLKATRMMTKIHQVLGKQIPLAEIFKTPTIRELASCIGAAGTEGYEAIPILDKTDYYEPSRAQERVWSVCREESVSVTYNMTTAYLMEGELDTVAFSRVLAALAERHESLRTVFREVDGHPKQVILRVEDCGVKVEMLDLSQGTDGEEEARQLAEREIETPFDLEKGPLLRAKLVKLGVEKHVFIFTMHHIISDGESMEVVSREVLTLYNDFIKGEQGSLQALRVHYKDYAAWHNERLKGDGMAKEEGSLSGPVPPARVQGSITPALYDLNCLPPPRHIQIL